MSSLKCLEEVKKFVGNIFENIGELFGLRDF